MKKIILFILLPFFGFSQVTFEQYGAIGNGTTNDRIAVSNTISTENVINAASGATYYISGNIFTSGRDVNIIGDAKDPATFLFKDVSSISLSGVSGVSDTLYSNASENDQYIILSNSAGFNINGLITITTSEAYSWGHNTDNDYRKGEIHKIVDIKSDTLYIEDKLWHDWNTTETESVSYFEPVTVKIENIVFKCETPQDISGVLYLSHVLDAEFKNVTVIDSKITGIMFDNCYNYTFTNGYISGSNHYNYGYGIRAQSCSFGKVTNSFFYGNFKAIESSCNPDYKFPNRNMKINNNFASGNGYIDNGSTIYAYGGRFFNSHSPSQNISITDNTINNYHTSVVTAGVDLFASENKIFGKSMYGFQLLYGDNYVITNNVFTGVLENSFIYFYNNAENINSFISVNHVDYIEDYFIMNGSSSIIENLTVTNNNIHFKNSGYLASMYNNYNYDNLSELNNILNSETSAIDPNADEKFVLNGGFDFDQCWNKQAAWAISDGVASCDGSIVGAGGGAIIYMESGIRNHNTEEFEVIFDVVSADVGASVGVYSPTGGYVYKSVVSDSTYIYSVVSNGSYDNIVIVNGALNKEFSIDNVTVKLK